MNFTPPDDIVSLLEFIENKKQTTETATINEIIRSYLISIKMAIINTYTEQEDERLAISCSDLIGNIFIVIYSYSLNIKLSLFICERAILLFNEYMNISNNYNSTPVHTTDIKQFIINKSIGPIMLKKSNSSITDFSKLFNTTKLFMNNIFLKCKHESIDYIETVLERILEKLPTSLINLFLKGQYTYIDEAFDKTTVIETDDIIFVLDKLSMEFEIYLFMYNSNNSTGDVKQLTTKMINHRKITQILNKIDRGNKIDLFKELSNLS